MPQHPLAEVFGFPVDNFSAEAIRHRAKRLCPYNNKVPSCTKDKARNPLGVCSIFEGDNVVITCPIRFRQDWLIADDAAAFFFPPDVSWTSLTEVRLPDKDGRSAGNIDVVLAAYDDRGRVIDFGSLEIQAVYISGNIRNAFEYYMESPTTRHGMTWEGANYPRPDYLSFRKQLALRMLFRGSILNQWKKKQAIAVDRNSFASLPVPPETTPENADVAWLVYELAWQTDRYVFKKHRTAYSSFTNALDKITTVEAGSLEGFIRQCQDELDEMLDGGYPPEAPSLADFIREW